MKRLSHMIADSTASGVYFLEETSSIAPVEAVSREQGLGFFYIDARDIHDKDTFLKETASALSFPEYFGNNWDALADCLTDMSWHETEGFVLVYDHFDTFAEHSPGDFGTALDIFKEAADYWRDSGKAAFVVLCGNSSLQGTLPQIVS